VKSIKNELIQIESTISSISSKIEAYSESLIDVDALKNSISKIENDIVLYTAKIQEYQQVPKPNLESYIKIESQIREKEIEISIAKTKRSTFFDQYRSLAKSKTTFNPKLQCNECGAKIDIEKSKLQHEHLQKDIENQLVILKQQIDDLDALISKDAAIKSLAQKISLKKNKESELFNKAQNSIQELKSLISRKQIEKDNFNEKLLNFNNNINKINELKQKLEKMYSLRALKTKDFEFYSTLSSIFSPTGAQAYILDSVIDSFNNRVAYYIDLIWPNSSYTLNSYKENNKGEVSAKFSETLTIDGIKISIGSLSGGELKALSLCIDFTIIDLLQTNFAININPIILDEPFDGLDQVGKEIVLNLLKKLAKDRQILVVDHSSEAKSMFSSIIMVEKRNGISSISSI
jgi:DNA repair exonuclease SbcCD ATPase subunit